ncbi:DNA primase [Gorillibacterium massiliense]|uniref:DNA primase n=1 Tax=Gorillibacterium massiliense TaxID=1280390 RepID=UPI0005933A8B|nr:DNA primase [Gorillibacterium massiliense]
MTGSRIPDDVIEAVLKRHDIVDVIGKYVHLTKQGHYLKGLCPFHSEKTPSFSVNPEKQFYHCFGCQAGGNLIHFVMEIEGFSFPEAVKQLAEEADIPFDWEGNGINQEKSEEQKDRDALYSAHEFATKLYQLVLTNYEQGRPALDYLRKRGISQKWIDFFQIGSAPATWDLLAKQLEKRSYSLPLCEKGGLVSAKSDGSGYVDKFRDRVLFPIHDFKGKVIAFAGRAIGDVQPKYLNSPETPLFNKSRNLFNFHRARPQIRKTGQVVLFEGFMDVIRAWEAGVENGVATMGTALTEDHVAILRRNAQEVIVCYDGDAAGQNAAYKALALFDKAGIAAKVAVLPEGKDPDEFISAYGAERFRREIIEGAVTTVRYKLQYVRKNFNLRNEDGRLRYLETAAKLIAELNSPLERDHYAKELTTELAADPSAFKQELHLARQELLHNKEKRDNNVKTWNNVMNDGAGAKQPAMLKRAYLQAEVRLLAVMMHDSDVAEYVKQRIGDQFNLDTHAALAAYLYAYYAQGNPPDISRYLATLHDDKLESAAGAILMTDIQGVNSQVIDDYIREIRKIPQQAAIKIKKEEQAQAVLSGDIMKAAQIGSEIIALEQQLNHAK